MTFDGSGPSPTLTTPRLVLRPHRVEDLADSHALWSDPDVVRFIGGRAMSLEDVWIRLLRHVGQWSVFGWGYFVVRDRTEGTFLGEIGYAEMKRALEPPFDAPESGLAFRPAAQGQGVAAEALRAVLAFGDQRLPDPGRSVCMIDPANHRSIRLAERHGYRAYATGRYRDADLTLFERPRGSGAESL